MESELLLALHGYFGHREINVIKEEGLRFKITVFNYHVHNNYREAVIANENLGSQAPSNHAH